MATFGLSVVAGNWVVTLLEREGHGRSVSGVIGGLVLFAGVVTRPAGGLVVRRVPARAWPLVGAEPRSRLGRRARARRGPAALARGRSPHLLVGLAAGFPFAAVFDMTCAFAPTLRRRRSGFVNGSAVLVILVCTPLAGLTFGLPGDGRIAFLAIGLLWAAALAAVPAARRS